MFQSPEATSENQNQQPPERPTILDILKKALYSVYKKYIAIVGFLYLTVQLYAIGKNIIIFVPPDIRLLTILIVSVYILYKVYTEIKLKFKKARDEILETIKSLNTVRDPENDDAKNLTYRDVEFAIYCLAKKIDQSGFLIPRGGPRMGYDPAKNILIGIDRGGAIVGGALGKILGLPLATLAIKWSPPEKSQCLDNIDFTRIDRILLVDDAIRTGKIMEKAIKILDDIKKTNPNLQYKKVCILYQRPWRGVKEKEAGDEDIKPVLPDFFVYPSRHGLIQMPWDMDVRHLLEKYDNEFRDFYNKSDRVCKEVIQ